MDRFVHDWCEAYNKKMITWVALHIIFIHLFLKVYHSLSHKEISYACATHPYEIPMKSHLIYEFNHNLYNTKYTHKQGNFSVNKSSVPFTSIGADHRIEQQKKLMKILGGIKGITNNQQALDEYFLTAGQMGTIIEELTKLFQIKENISHKKDQHYQLTGSKNKRISIMSIS